MLPFIPRRLLHIVAWRALPLNVGTTFYSQPLVCSLSLLVVPFMRDMLCRHRRR